MTGPIELGRDRAAEHDRAVLAALDACGDGGLAAGELAARSEVPPSTLRRRVADLVAAGLVQRDSARGRVRITPEGRHRLGGRDLEVRFGAGLGGALELLPCEAYRAMVRLMVAAVVARHHLRQPLPEAVWPSFAAFGGTAEGKTLLARVLCRLFGLDAARSIRLVPRATAAELVGRRERRPGEGWVFEPADLLSAPFVCLDEVDKASTDTRGAVLTLMQGDAVTVWEDQGVTIAPVVYAVGNVDAAGGAAAIQALMADAYLGRSVVLDTRSLHGLLDDVGPAAAALLVPGALPRLRLERLIPPTEQLPRDHLEAMRSWLRGLLTDRGWRLARVEALSLLPLGMATLYPDHVPAAQRLAMATMQVLLDYLTVTSTMDGRVRPDWPALAGDLQHWLRDAMAEHNVSAETLPLPDLAAYTAERGRQSEASRRRRVERYIEGDELTAERGRLTYTIDLAVSELDGRRIRSWTRAQQVQAAGVRDVLKKLRAEAAHAKTSASLRAVADRALPRLANVDELLRVAEAERVAAAAAGVRLQLEAKQAVEERREAERVQRQQAAWHARELREATAARGRRIRELERLLKRRKTREGEPVLKALVIAGVVQPERVVEERPVVAVSERFRAWRDRRPAEPFRIDQVAATYLVDRNERRYTPAELAQWESASTRAALNAGIAFLQTGGLF